MPPQSVTSFDQRCKKKEHNTVSCGVLNILVYLTFLKLVKKVFWLTEPVGISRRLLTKAIEVVMAEDQMSWNE